MKITLCRGKQKGLERVQSNNTKSENLEHEFKDILEKTHFLGWNEVRNWSSAGLNMKRKKALKSISVRREPCLDFLPHGPISWFELRVQ